MSEPMFSELEVFFFFNDTATTEIYTLSLHDALPILRTSTCRMRGRGRAMRPSPSYGSRGAGPRRAFAAYAPCSALGPRWVFVLGFRRRCSGTRICLFPHRFFACHSAPWWFGPM